MQVDSFRSGCKIMYHMLGAKRLIASTWIAHQKKRQVILVMMRWIFSENHFCSLWFWLIKTYLQNETANFKFNYSLFSFFGFIIQSHFRFNSSLALFLVTISFIHFSIQFFSIFIALSMSSNTNWDISDVTSRITVLLIKVI